MDIRVDRNLETYKCYTFLEMGNDEGYDYKVNLRRGGENCDGRSSTDWWLEDNLVQHQQSPFCSDNHTGVGDIS